MVEEEKSAAPCVESPTSCMKAFLLRRGKLPCMLYDKGHCTPANVRDKLIASGQRSPEWIAQRVEVSMHINCPISDSYSGNPDDIRDAIHELYDQKDNVSSENSFRRRVMQAEEPTQSLQVLLSRINRK